MFPKCLPMSCHLVLNSFTLDFLGTLVEFDAFPFVADFPGSDNMILLI